MMPVLVETSNKLNYSVSFFCFSRTDTKPLELGLNEMLLVMGDQPQRDAYRLLAIAGTEW